MMEANKIEQENNNSIELAALWNQHDICPECRSGDIKVIDHVVHGLFKNRHEPSYKCMNCGCSWW